MLKIYDSNKNALGYITKYKDLEIESELYTGDKSLSFVYLAKKAKNIQNEYYLETKTDRYVIKESGISTDGFPEFRCQLDLEDLEADMFESFSALECNLTEAANLALAGTGWTVETDIVKIRSVATLKATPLTILGKIRDAWMCEMQFDNKNKIVRFYEQFGEDRGVFFTTGLNLHSMDLTIDSYEYYTRLIPIGKDNLRINSVNDGVRYVENFQYSNKIRTFIWEDSSYTDPAALKEDAEKKLEDLSKPKKSYSADIINLAKIRPEYTVLSFGLGDTVLLLDEKTGIKEKQRIVKLTEYPQDSSKNKCELSNTTLTFEEQQAKLEAAAAALENISNADGTVNGVYVHGVEADGLVGIETVISNSTSVQNLNGEMITVTGRVNTLDSEMNATKLRVGTLETTYLKATDAELKYATIEQLDATSVTLHSLQGDYASFKTTTTNELAAQKARIENLETSKITTEYLEANYATISNLNSATARIGKLETDTLKTADLSVEVAKLGYATISSLNATNATVTSLQGDYASFKTATTNALSTQKALIDDLEASQITTDYLESNYAQIDLANIEAGCIKTAMLGTGVVGTAQIADGSITDAKIVGLTASKITAGTLDAGTIDVINLNAANITVGTINGQQIAAGAIDTTKLSSSLNTTITNADANASQALLAAGTAQTTADGKNTVFYQASAPATSGRKVNDIWYDTDDGFRMYYWNGNIWTATQFGTSAVADNVVTADKIADSVNQKIADAFTNAGMAITAAGTAQSTADAAVANAATAQSTADTAVANAATAQSTANQAVTNAETAQSTADLAKTNAQTAQITANQAVTDASKAQNTADTAVTNAAKAQSTANTAVTNAEIAQSTANTAKTNADNAQSTADTAKSNAETAQTTANTAMANAATAQSTADAAAANAATALSQTAEFIQGTQTTATGSWTGKSTTITKLYDGLQITYWLPYAGSGNATLNLTLADGTTTGAVNCYHKGTTRITTHYAAGSTIRLTYRVNAKISGSSTTYTGWWADGSYEGSNTYDRTRYSNVVKSLEALTKSTYYIMVGTGSGYKKAASGVSFDISYPVLTWYYTTAVSANATTAYMYTAMPGVTLRNNVSNWTGTQYAMVYLVGTLLGKTFTINSTVFTTTTPTSADGLYYIPIGILYSTYQIYFRSDATVYAYGPNGFAPVSANAQTTADGKNTVFYQASAPATSGRKVNDVWFDTDDGNKMYYWSGSAWTVKQFGTNAIANLAITNALIADAAIQSAKIANLDAGKITSGYIAAARIEAGSITAAKLAADTITANSGVIADAAILTANIADLAVTTAKIAALAVGTAQIQDAAITNAKISALDAGKITSGYIAAARIKAGTIATSHLAADAVTADKIATGAVTTETIAASAVTTDKIVAAAITGEKIASKTISANNIAAGAITASELAAGAVTTDKLVANAVTAAKINISDLFAQDITATGTITGATIVGGKFSTINALTCDYTEIQYGNLTQRGTQIPYFIPSEDEEILGIEVQTERVLKISLGELTIKIAAGNDNVLINTAVIKIENNNGVSSEITATNIYEGGIALQDKYLLKADVKNAEEVAF